MDRFSIIQIQLFDQDPVDEVNSCGQEECECMEGSMNKKQLVRKKDVAHLVAVVTMAFLTAFGILNKMNAANANLFAKRYTALPCYTNVDRTGRPLDKKLPGDKNHQSNCSHQQGCLSETKSSKRKSLKTHYC